MSRRFITLLERTAFVRKLIEREESCSEPNALRLMRMKRLSLRLSTSLRAMTAKRLVAMASAPRFTPRFA